MRSNVNQISAGNFENGLILIASSNGHLLPNATVNTLDSFLRDSWSRLGSWSGWSSMAAPTWHATSLGSAARITRSSARQLPRGSATISHHTSRSWPRRRGQRELQWWSSWQSPSPSRRGGRGARPLRCPGRSGRSLGTMRFGTRTTSSSSCMHCWLCTPCSSSLPAT